MILRLVWRRLLATIPVLLGVTVVTFAVVTLLPSNAAQQLAGAEATAAQVALLESKLELDRPAWRRYLDWVGGVLTGDLGNSFASGRPVTALLSERLPVTLELVAYALVIALGLALPTALAAARKPSGIVDRLAAALSLTALSTASYVLALVLVLVFAVELALLPSVGFSAVHDGLAANLSSLTLPATAIAFPLFGFYTRFLRGDLLEQMRDQDYVVAAAAKGVGPWRVLLRHALPNSLFGLLTVVGLNFGTLVGGTVIVERIFALPGMGQLLLESIALRDELVVQAGVLVLTMLTVTANLTVDLLYLALDPRVRYERH